MKSCLLNMVRLWEISFCLLVALDLASSMPHTVLEFNKWSVKKTIMYLGSWVSSVPYNQEPCDFLFPSRGPLHGPNPILSFRPESVNVPQGRKWPNHQRLPSPQKGFLLWNSNLFSPYCFQFSDVQKYFGVFVSCSLNVVLLWPTISYPSITVNFQVFISHQASFLGFPPFSKYIYGL